MLAVATEIWVASITAGTSLLVGVGALYGQLRRLDSNNREDHAKVQQGLNEVRADVRYVARRIDKHIDEHNKVN